MNHDGRVFKVMSDQTQDVIHVGALSARVDANERVADDETGVKIINSAGREFTWWPGLKDRRKFDEPVYHPPSAGWTKVIR